MAAQDDLSLLGLSSSDKGRLKAMGLTTLEQIALLEPWELSLGKEKSKSIIGLARNILANRHLREIEILRDLVIVTLDREVTEPLRVSVLHILGANTGEYGNCRVEISGNKVKLYNTFNISNPFSMVVENARKWQNILEAKNREKLRSEGVTLGYEEIIRFARERGFKGFYENFFSELIGGETLKAALTVALFSTFEEPNHVLVIGDPASGKTLAKEIILQNIRDVTNISAMSTRAGLVVNLSTGQLGALAYSDRKLVVVDEFDKIPAEDVKYIYELLSNGKVSVHSANIHADIESHFIMIAFANPRGGAFRGNPMNEINLDPPLISRFSLIIKCPILGEEERKEVFRRKFLGSEIQMLPQYYDQWIKLARLHKPRLEVSQSKLEAYIDEVNKMITRLYSAPLRRDLRMADYAKRIPFSIARAEFGNVTDETLDIALDLINRSIDEWYHL